MFVGFYIFRRKMRTLNSRRLVVLHSSRTTTVISAVHSYMRPLVIPCCTETTQSASQKHEVTVANPSRQPTEKAIVWKDTLMVDYTHVLLLLLRAGHGTGPVHEGGEY